MYIVNNMCPYKLRQEPENKCARIFRPWDSHDGGKDNMAQDSTISTTTTEDEEVKNTEETLVKKHSTKTEYENEKCNKKTTCSESVSRLPSDTFPLPPEAYIPTPPLPLDYIHDPYNVDLIQTNLAQHLGLPPNDPLLLESIAQGYALEEYARVLNQEQQAKLLSAKKQRPKKYKCPHCDVGFSNNGQLKGHIRIHTGERPFKCDEKECGKTFTRNEELTRHKRIHSGLRPFPCSHCGKRFGRKDHLKKHSRTHFQPRGLYAVPVVMPFEAWASGQASNYPFFPVMY